MASAELRVKVATKFPWWWRAVFVLGYLRLMPPSWAVNLIMRYTRVDVEPV